MSNEADTAESSFEIVHICEKCGAAFTYSQVAEDVTVTGIIECPVCGHVGGLHVEVREASDKSLK